MVVVETRERMLELGKHVAHHLQPGDLVVLVGDLGAGKTTFTQGLGRGLGIKDPITSPTFVIARAHLAGTHPLVHVDAYRLGSTVELDELDLDADLGSSITVVEWGEGKVEQLAEDRLTISILRSDDDDETRSVQFSGVGERWNQAALQELSSPW
jgi:tRNA threonylcarbamoyladenosine biosynthesis protein TsaE